MFYQQRQKLRVSKNSPKTNLNINKTVFSLISIFLFWCEKGVPFNWPKKKLRWFNVRKTNLFLWMPKTMSLDLDISWKSFCLLLWSELRFGFSNESPNAKHLFSLNNTYLYTVSVGDSLFINSPEVEMKKRLIVL